MRGHGFTVVGSSIEECVFRAVYTAENASIQTATITTHMGYYGGSQKETEIRYLKADEWGPSTSIGKWSYMRPWNLWLREVEAVELYKSNMTKN